MNVMTMKIPAIRASLLEGGSPGRSAGARSVCSGSAGEGMATPEGRTARTAGGRRAKAGREWEPQRADPATFAAKLQTTIHPERGAHTPPRIADRVVNAGARRQPDRE